MLIPDKPPATSYTSTDSEVLIIGAGLTGMSAAAPLGSKAIVLEASSLPGGLVKSLCFEGYWFDHVIHLLYLPDEKTKRRIHEMFGETLAPCHPIAWVESLAGRVRYPFQSNLGSLPDMATVIECIKGFAAVAYETDCTIPAHYEDMLRQTFGTPMCERFFFPYNRKMWRRSLDGLAPSGFHWNIDRPDFEQLLKSIIDPGSRGPSYNADGWYPRPPPQSPVRGMGFLSEKLAEQVHDLRLEHCVTSVDLEKQELGVITPQGHRLFSYQSACLSTMPLPLMVKLCRQSSRELLRDMDDLQWNRVRSVGLNIKGPRPTGLGHWCYYADESIIFTRLVFLHEFDPELAPPEGWPLLVEITEPAESPPLAEAALIKRVLEDLRRTGVLPAGSEVIAAHSWICDPAYVVFTPDNQDIMREARAFLQSGGVMPLGRYGHWEYSSMGQVMRDGHTWAENQLIRGSSCKL